MSIELQYQSSFYKPKTYKDMEETLFKLTRAITDTGTDTVSSEGGTVTYRITSLKRKLVNGKVISTSTPSCTLGSASVSWATWGGVTVGDGYLDVKINYSENTGSSRSTTLIFTQNESNNKINLTVTQGSGVTYSGYIEMVSNTLPLGGNKDDTAQILVMAYLNGSDGSKKPETPHVGSAPDWCSVSVAQVGTPENHYMLTLTALSNNNTGASRSGYILVTCGDQRREVTIWQKAAEQDITLTIHWPLNTFSGAFFKEGQTPQTGSTGTAYFNFSVLDDTSVHKYKKSEGVRVNLRNGSTEIAYPGDRISAYRFTNQTWQLRSTFLLPSSDQIITL
jgi:hypothetical protein